VTCQLQKERFSSDTSIQLRFSADSLVFDTLFTDNISISKRLKIYNDDKNGVVIKKIELSQPDSPFRLTINGKEGTSFNDVQLLGKDSSLILVKAFINSRDQDLPFIVEDKIHFLTNGNKQDVFLFSWGQDANYVSDSILSCSTTWTAARPYVIFNSMLVDSLCTLKIEPGTRIFSHHGSTIYIKGRLQVNGTASERVVFTNDRFDPAFVNTPGQWEGVNFLPGSKGNSISFATIKNATYGIWLGTPDEDSLADLTVSQTVIENSASSGVIAFSSDLTMVNCLIANAGDFVVAGLAGGNYQLLHCTLVNAGTLISQQPTAGFNDQLQLSDGTFIGEDLLVRIKNSIIWGPSSDELLISSSSQYVVGTDLFYNLIKSSVDSLTANMNILNEDPLFISADSSQFSLDVLSPAIDAGIDLGVKRDLLDSLRIPPPDLGAYEFKK